MRINLGCGTDLRPGWVNVDVRPEVGADVVADIRRPLPFPNSCADVVSAQDVVEHLTQAHQDHLWAEVSRILRPGGKLTVRLPNVDDIVTRFASDTRVRNLFLYGDTSVSGEWGAHKWVPTPSQLQAAVMMHQLEKVRFRPVTTNYEFEFVKRAQPLVGIKSLAFLNQTFGLGGAEIFNAQLLNWLAQAGISISSYVTYPQFAARLSSPHRLPFVVDVIGDWKGLIKGLIVLPLAAIYYGWLTWSLSRYDIIFLTGFIEKILVTPWAKLFKVPVIWEEFGPLETVTRKFWGLPGRLYDLVKSLPDVIIVPSQNTRRALALHNHVSPAKLVVVPCARDIPKLTAKTSHRLLAVCISRLEPGKGHDLLIRTWKDVVGVVPQAKLKIVGEGAERVNLELAIKNLKLTDSVELVGWVEDALTEMAQARVVVFPSLWPLEGFGLVAIEAMGMGKPVVGFNFGPLPEIVDASCGILVPAGNTSALAAALVKLLTHPGVAKKLGQAGRDKYLGRYTFSRIGPQFMHQFRLAKAYVQVK